MGLRSGRPTSVGSIVKTLFFLMFLPFLLLTGIFKLIEIAFDFIREKNE